MALQDPDDDITFEMAFDDDKLLKADDLCTFEADQRRKVFRIASIRKVDRILAPNVSFDYRLIALGL